MKTISRYIMTLALLITAASGAWADETPIVTITATGSGPAYSVEGIVTLETGGAAYAAGYGWYNYSPINLTVTAADGVTITKVKFIGNQGGSWEDTESPFQVLLQSFYVKNASGTNIGSDDGVTSIEVYGTIAPAGPEVTINDTKTEASFEMPTSDVTIDYELVRDMSIQMTATMGDGTDGVRYRVKKAQQGGGYEPADLNMMQVLALVAVNDGIEQKALTLEQDYYCRIYKLDEQTQQPEGDGVTLIDFDFAPGLYALKAFAQNGSDYDGETALSNTFKLFEGYPVTVAGGEYITYYSATENLKIENDDAQLYTITAVDGTKATAAEIASANKEMPFLVYNKLEQEQEIVLIPTEDQINQAVYSGFKGTAEGQQISSTATTDSYVMTGKQFVWLKDAGLIAAQRCWLEVPKTSAQSAPVIYIQTDGMSTGVKEVKEVTEVNDNGDWYDLNGRKLQAAPTKKGVYILNGKKIVVR